MYYRLLTQMLLVWVFKQTLFEVSCSPTCSQLQGANVAYAATCSCSESCQMNGNCNPDAPYQNTGSEKFKQLCITLRGLGPASLVSGCPWFTVIKSKGCVHGLEANIPVRSADTGKSYSNYYYALCNRNLFSAEVWPVHLRCCNDFLQPNNNNYRFYLESESIHGSKSLCECKSYARNDDVTFAKSLELRKCVQDVISQCFLHWGNQTFEELCSSYADPLCTVDKNYRKEYCSLCNDGKFWIRRCSTFRNTRQVTSNKKNVADVMDLVDLMRSATGCPPGKALKRGNCVPYIQS